MKKLLVLIAFSGLLLVPLGSQNAFAGGLPEQIQCIDDSDCAPGDGICDAREQCNLGLCVSVQPDAPLCPVGGYIIPVESTPVILAGAQTSASWMIPVIVSGIGFAIVIARKF